MKRRVARVVVAAAGALLLVATAAPAGAYVPQKTPRREAEAIGRRAASLAPARGARIGFVLMRGGREIASLNATAAVVPASLAKLFTTTAAVLRFGPNHRFATRALAPERGPAPGALYLVGGGDPTLASESYRRQRFLPKPTDRVPAPAFPGGSPTVEGLALRIQRAGVRSVAGDLIVDDTLFDAVRVPPGWLERYLTGEPESGLISALSINEGRGDPLGRTLLPDPTAAAGEELRRALAQRGIEVAGRIRRGRAPATAVEVARVESPPLRELIGFTNRYSVNFPAEVLLKSLGAAHGEGGTSAAGVAVVREAMGQIAIPTQGLIQHDGSGLSELNRIPPRTVARLLDWMLGAPQAAALRESLPVAGGPGTLVRRMTQGPARGNLRGKTGLLRGVRAMAGWVERADGVPVVYVAVFNGARRAGLLTGALDLIGSSLAASP